MVARNGNALNLSNCNLFSLAATNVALIHNISKSAIKIGSSELIPHKIMSHSSNLHAYLNGSLLEFANNKV